MTITVTGPDGSNIAFPDGTPEAEITSALDSHFGNKGGDLTVNSAARSVATGVPIVGGMLNKANAATNAALAPVLNPLFSEKDQLKEPTFGERYSHSLKDQEAMDKAFQEQHPILDPVLQTAGGVAATLPLMATAAGAKAFGVTGKTLPAMLRGGGTGGVIGATDAEVRGQDAATGAVTGAAFGAGGSLLGKGIGAAYDKARGAIRAEPPIPQRVVDVNGTPVPMSESAITRDPAAAAREQMMARGALGDPAQAVATAAREETQAALKTAHDNFAAGLDPNAPPPGSPPPAAPVPKVTPEVAGQTVATDLVTQEQQRAAAEVARLQGAANERLGIKADMEPPPAARPPAPAATAETPYSMGETISNGVQQRFQAARAARTAAYDRLGVIPGEYEPAVFMRAGNAIRNELSAGAEPVRVSNRVTPNVVEGLSVIDNDLGHLRFENQARQGPAIPITNADVEATRKQLVILQRQANSAARIPGGSAEDARGMRRLIEEFDAHKERGIQAGGFSGDGQAVLRAGQQARALHAELRRNYSAQGPGDKVGRIIEDIIGRYPGQEIAPDKIVQHLFGSASEPGGGNTVQLAQHLQRLLGPNSPEWAAIRKAAIAHVTEAPAGLDPIPHAVQADRIMNLLNGTKGRLLAQTLFSPAERTRLAEHAANLRAVADPAPANGVERLIAKLSGRDGSPPASTTEVVNQLFDLKANKETAVQLARELKTRLSPESFGQVKQGMWSRLTEAPEGMIPWESQRISQNLHNFLKSDLANSIYTPNERMLMKSIADAHSKQIPVAGSTNPSGTAPMLAKIAKGAQNQLLALFGFSHGGVPGAAAAMAGGKALAWRANRNAAAEATKLFYGEQPKAPESKAARQLAVLLSQSPVAQRNQRSR